MKTAFNSNRFFHFLLIIALVSVLVSCKKTVYDHIQIEFTFPDQSVENISLCLDNSLVITYHDRYYAVRSKGIHESSADIEVVEISCIADTTEKIYNLLKLDHQLLHLVKNQDKKLLTDLSTVFVKLVDVAELSPDPSVRQQCYSQLGCCYSSCNIMVCCLGNAECESENCQCTTPAQCANFRDIPSVREFGKLFSREKVNAKIPMHN